MTPAEAGFDDLQWLEPMRKRTREIEAETKAIRALNQLYKDNDKAMKTLAAMRPKFRVILDQAIEEGVRRGYHKAYKHTDAPTDEAVISTIEDCVIGALYEYFDFEEEV